jgi:hypothetical protein
MQTACETMMPFPRVRRYLQGAIMGLVIGRHGWAAKTACRAFCAVCPNPIRSSACWTCTTGRGGLRGVWSEAGLARAGWTNGRAGWRWAVSCRKDTFPPSPSRCACGSLTKIFLPFSSEGGFAVLTMRESGSSCSKSTPGVAVTDAASTSPLT